MLASFILCFSATASAEPKYYTWVDAQGVVHNTLIEDKATDKDSVKDSDKKASLSKEGLANEGNPTSKDSSSDKPDFDGESYKTEEEYQQSQKDREDKPFYTWTDVDGTIRSSEKPDVFVEFTSTEAVYDAVFAPPFRLPAEITEGVCCKEFKSAFKKELIENTAVVQKINSSSFPYKTQSGDVPAGYFILPEHERAIVFIKAYKLKDDDTFEIVALNEDFQPLYLADNLSGLFIEQTWKDIAYKKVMVEISDEEVRYLIVFSSNQNIDFEKGYSLSVSQGPASE